MWSRKNEKCVECGTTSKKHHGHGLCSSCWLKDWTKKNYDRRRVHKSREYIKNKERYQKNSKIYQQKNKAVLSKYWSDWHKNKNFNGKYSDVLSRDNNECLLCSTKEMIIMHHIDGDNKNNGINNLATLCRRCHPRIHYSKKSTELKNELLEKMEEMKCLKYRKIKKS